MLLLTKILAGAFLGAALGFGYYKMVGCSTGACPLTSNPWITTGYGMLIGVMFAIK